MKVKWRIVLLLLSLVLLTGCGEERPSPRPLKKDAKPFAAFKWYDTDSGDPTDNSITLNEFPGVVFHSSFGSISAETDEGTTVLYYGMPVIDVYFCDLNGDGKPELCSNILFGSGMIDEHFIIYDYVNGTQFEKSDRSIYDYKIYLNDISLMVNKYKVLNTISGSPAEPALIDNGQVIYKDGEYQIIWNNDNSVNWDDTFVNLVKKVSFANYAKDSLLYKNALNSANFILSSARHVPIYKFDSLKELTDFKKTYQNILTLNEGYQDIPSFQEVTKNYDETFFQEKSVLLAYVPASSGSFRFDVTDISLDGGTLTLFISQINHPEAYDDAMSGWFTFVEIDKAIIRNFTSFDARIVLKSFKYDYGIN